MANAIELITKYSTKAWDKVYKAESRSALLDAPEAQVQFTGAKTVKIAKFTATGLGNYYRNNEVGDYNPYPGTSDYMSGTPFGYAAGNAGLVWEEFTLACDRSARYQIEHFDNEETDGLALGAATTEISRTVMIPEVDAYCFSKVAAKAGKTEVAAITGDHAAFKALNAALVYFDEKEVPAEKQIIFVSPKFLNKLRDDTMAISRILKGDVDENIKFTIDTYEGRKLVMVPPQRFRTDIKLTNSGYTWGGSSKFIDFMVVATDAVMHIVKYNKVKVIGGDMNLAGANFDGYSIFARIYHDVFVPDNKVYGIYAHIEGSESGQNLSVTSEGEVVTIAFNGTTNKISELTLHDPSRLVKYYKLAAAYASYSSVSSLGVGDVLPVSTLGADLTEAKVGDSVTKAVTGGSPANGTVVYAVGANNIILALKEYE